MVHFFFTLKKVFLLSSSFVAEHLRQSSKACLCGVLFRYCIFGALVLNFGSMNLNLKRS